MACIRLPMNAFAVIAVLCWARGAAADVDFVRDVRPILRKHCYGCHGAEKQKSGLRLDVKAAAMKGGDGYGPSIVPKKAADSPLIQFVSRTDPTERMPPEGAGLSSAEIATLTAWINEGAVWPDGVDEVQLKDQRDHWSFKPLAVAAGKHSIDSFIIQKLGENGLALSPETDRVTWLRRASLDLTGLPPTPEQTEAFANDQSSDAFERIVEELLASPHYGERWAQHWLDVVRYADTHGFEVNTERPHAWPYRDYVIDSFNADVPYDRFIREQIAGDALGQDAATGFLVTASVLLPGQIGKDEPSKRLARQDALDEIVNNIGQTFLGLSIGCARCHDHKFDPISAKDYYSMQAFVAGVEYQDRELHTPAADAARRAAAKHQRRIAEIDRELTRYVPLANSGAQRPMLNPRENVDRFAPVAAKRVRFTIRETNSLEPCIDELEVFNTDGENVALASSGATATSSGDTIVADRHDLKYVNDGRYGNARSWMSNEKGCGWVVVEFAQTEQIQRVVWGRDRQQKFKDRLATDYVIEAATETSDWRTVADASDRRDFDPSDSSSPDFSTAGLDPAEARIATELMEEKKRLDALVKTKLDAQQVFAGAFRMPDKIHLLSRGDPEQPKEEVVPAVPRSLGNVILPSDAAEQQRRMALADWIASPQNPLTARVMVNRIWQGHFGMGIVPTPSDFGNNGLPPTHPELLDWLAAEFIRSGWSVKQMHRLIVMSQTYRQSSRIIPAGVEQDADVRWLWRYPARRLEAEAIRDSMLFVGGALNLTMYGRGYDLFDKRGGLTGFKPVESFKDAGRRRMIYAHKVRRETDAVFGAFDCPDGGQSMAARRASATPVQALNLFNSRFTLDASAALATRVRKDVGDDVTRQIRRAYVLSLNRLPSADEMGDAEHAVRQFGLATLCRAIFNSNEFLFLP